MSDRKRPSELDDADLADLYGETAQDLPPVRLDEQILEAARAQQQRAAVNGAVQERSGWLVGRLPAALASAAVLVMTITVVARFDAPIPAAEEGPALEMAQDRPVEHDSTLAEIPAPAPAAAFEGEERADYAISPQTSKEAEPVPPVQQKMLASRRAERVSAAASTASAARPCSDTERGFCLDGNGVSVKQPQCPEPFRLPEGASAPAMLDDGVVFLLDGDPQRVVCRDGVWEAAASVESSAVP